MRLIDADALKETIEDHVTTVSCCPTVDWSMGKTQMKKDVLEDIDNAPTVTQEPGWISVEDRLPQDKRFVLVCNDDGHMMVAQYIEETAQWQYKYINYDVDVWDDEEQGPVCWWAELPEPPKEG